MDHITLDELWLKYKRVIPGKKRKRQDFKKALYQMEHIVEPVLAQPEHDGDEDGQVGHAASEDGDEGSGFARAIASGVVGSSSAMMLVSLAAPIDGGLPPRLERSADEIALTMDYLKKNRVPYAYISVVGESRPKKVTVIQVLKIAANDYTVPTFRITRIVNKVDVFDIVCQELEVWAGAATASSKDFEVIALSDPSEMDLIPFVETTAGFQVPRVTVWSEGPSDGDGCYCLTNPNTLQTDLPLNNAKIPVLLLMSCLQDNGWLPVPGLLITTQDRLWS